MYGGGEKGTMKLAEMLSGLASPKCTHETAAINISGVSCDSRQVKPGHLFIAFRGTSLDGKEFVNDAVTRGAAAVLSDGPIGGHQHLPQIHVDDARAALGELAASFYGRPSRRLEVVGITGTNGKTTVAFLTRHILEMAGRTTGLISTVRYEIGARTIPASRTTPDAIGIQRMMSEMLQVGCTAAVIEVSSHGIDQKRVCGTDFDVRVFTNLSRDHLDYHVGMDDYFNSKAAFFEMPESGSKSVTSVCNTDDPWGRKLVERIRGKGTCVTFGIDGGSSVCARDVHLSRRGSEFEMISPWGRAHVKCAMMGRFNVSNALAAAAACGALGVEPSVIGEALSTGCRVPGRLEEVSTGKGFRVYVDYAHTDDALRSVLTAIRETGPARIIAVFGCGGNRDKTKRPVMGEVAAQMADHTILTSDNPRRENPIQIIEQIREGFGTNGNFEVIEDRAAAIRQALSLAKKGDVVLIAGKGHETFQELANTTVPFDDRQVVKNMVGEEK
jgi:UDP-N-acetylmuramoyl-L-alanyl-D-glutamate--2,6-diaminopimelate ligase